LQGIARKADSSAAAISERTVSRLLRTLRRPPNQTWRTFLHNHIGQMVSTDFFTVPTIMMKVLFVFLVLEHDRRKVLHFGVIAHPTAAWTAQQIVEAFGGREPARYLIRDRDSIYGTEVCLRIALPDTEEVLRAPQSPWQNPYAERLIGSIRRECLNHFVILSAKHLKKHCLRISSITIRRGKGILFLMCGGGQISTMTLECGVGRRHRRGPEHISRNRGPGCERICRSQGNWGLAGGEGPPTEAQPRRGKGTGDTPGCRNAALGTFGKIALWHTLIVAAETDERLRDVDFQQLVTRAQTQHARTEENRLLLARKHSPEVLVSSLCTACSVCPFTGLAEEPSAIV
jgi:hypothetical protein